MPVALLRGWFLLSTAFLQLSLPFYSFPFCSLLCQFLFLFLSLCLFNQEEKIVLQLCSQVLLCCYLLNCSSAFNKCESKQAISVSLNSSTEQRFKNYDIISTTVSLGPPTVFTKYLATFQVYIIIGIFFGDVVSTREFTKVKYPI